jgi:hypothetical protein
MEDGREIFPTGKQSKYEATAASEIIGRTVLANGWSYFIGRETGCIVVQGLYFLEESL